MLGLNVSEKLFYVLAGEMGQLTAGGADQVIVALTAILYQTVAVAASLRHRAAGVALVYQPV